MPSIHAGTQELLGCHLMPMLWVNFPVTAPSFTLGTPTPLPPLPLDTQTPIDRLTGAHASHDAPPTHGSRATMGLGGWGSPLPRTTQLLTSQGGAGGGYGRAGCVRRGADEMRSAGLVRRVESLPLGQAMSGTVCVCVCCSGLSFDRGGGIVGIVALCSSEKSPDQTLPIPQ